MRIPAFFYLSLQSVIEFLLHMKRYLYLLFLSLLTIVPSAQAQLNRDLSPRLNLGLTAGFNITHMNYDVNSSVKEHAKNSRGVHIGPSVVYVMPATGWGLDASVLYDYRTAEFTDIKNSDGSTKSRISTSQLIVPVNVRYGRDVLAMLNVFAYAGPQFNILLNTDKVEVQGADWTPCASPLSVNFGIGLMAMDRVQARIGYNLSLKKNGEFIYKGDVEGSGKSNAVQISVTYLF